MRFLRFFLGFSAIGLAMIVLVALMVAAVFLATGGIDFVP